MAKTKNWGIVARGELANPIGRFRVANLSDVTRWWKRGIPYAFESYATHAEAQARVDELIAARARELDADRTHLWKSIRVSGYATAKL
jgi:hypothetical protein